MPMARPAWVDDRLFPFESHFMDLHGATVHFIDEGEGPVFLALHGNPTWSFLYRHIVRGLEQRFRCVALDYPGFGLSTAPPDYGFRVAEHAGVVGAFIEALDLQGVTMMVQDWGGPIGMWNAVRQPDRFRAFVIGNTWGWPAQGDRSFERFSHVMSSPVGRSAIRYLDVGTRLFVTRGARPKRLSSEEKAMYRMPHPTPASRRPIAIMPNEILEARALLEEVERGLPRVSHLPALIVWGDRDPAFRERHRVRWERIFPNHRTVVLKGASHYIQEGAPEEIVAAIGQWWPGEAATTV